MNSKSVGIVDRDVIEVVNDLMAFADQIAGALHDGQGRQAQEIHLEQSERFEDRHLELGDGLDRAFF